MDKAGVGSDGGRRGPADRTIVMLLMLVGMLGSLATHLIVPSLPSLQRSFDIDYSTVQLLVSMFIIAYGATQIFAGAFADAYGRKRVLLFGMGVFAISSAACAFTTDIETLLVLRMVQGASGCFGLVLARAIVRDLSKGDASAMLGYLAVGTSISPMLAPVLGGLIYQAVGWTGPFWFMAIFASVAFLLVAFIIPETAPSIAGLATLKRLPHDFTVLLRNRRFIVYSSTICFNTAIFYSFVIGGALISNRDLGLTPAAYGLWFSITALGYAVGNFFSGKLGRRWNGRRQIMVGAIVVFLSLLAMNLLFFAGFVHPTSLFLTMTVATFASGFIMPNALGGTLAIDPLRAGSASGLVGFLQFATAALFSQLAAMLVEGSTPGLLLMLLALSIVSIGCARACVRFG